MAAIHKKMSGDITKIDPKIFLGFTPKQVAYIVIGVVLECINIKTFKSEFIGVLIAVICWLGGWIKIGEPPTPFFKWMRICFRFAFSQKERVYATEEIEEEEGLKEKFFNIPTNTINFIKSIPSLIGGVAVSIKTACTDFIYNKKEKKRKKIDEENMEE